MNLHTILLYPYNSGQKNRQLINFAAQNCKHLYRRIFRNEPKCCLVHIPKTGGTYIMQHESGEKPVVSPIRNFGHCLIVNQSNPEHRTYGRIVGYLNKPEIDVAKIRRYYVLSVVRNPFAWLVGYAGHAGVWKTKYLNTEHYDYPIAQKGFEYLIKTIAEREDPIWPNRKFIYFSLFCHDGSLGVDRINHTEVLNQDLATVADRMNLRFIPKETQRQGVKKDYRSMYSDQLAELVYKTWSREFQLFGYSFEGFNPEYGIIDRDISRKLRKSIFYHWETDKLFIENKEMEREI